MTSRIVPVRTASGVAANGASARCNVGRPLDEGDDPFFSCRSDLFTMGFQALDSIATMRQTPYFKPF
jgi:hypothetical protein